MFIGIILAVIFCFLVLNIVVKRLKNESAKKYLRMAHKWLGVLFLIVAVIHMTATWGLLKQRPILMYVLGFVMIAAALLALLSFVFRKQLKAKWFVLHRISTAVILVCLLLHVFIGFSSLSDYKKAVSEIDISNVEPSDVSDGTYIGECNVGYIYAKVEVKVENGQIENVTLLEHRTERGKPAEVIVNQIVEKQAVKVDAVSSATNSSKVIMKAVEKALEGEKEAL